MFQQRLSYILLSVMLLVALFLHLNLGVTKISWSEAFTQGTTDFSILWKIRGLRAFSAIIVGALLATTGAAMQNLFRNPLATPGIIGTSGGAGFGALVAIQVISVIPLIAWAEGILITLGAFLGAILATAFIYSFSTKGKFTDLSYLLIGGLSLNIFFSAAIAIVLFFSNDFTLRSFTYWNMGDLGRLPLHFLPFILITSGGTLFFLFRQHQALDVLAHGESEAFHLGVSVEYVKRMVIIIAGLAVAIAVSTAGIIGFVGLMVPHILRSFGIRRMKHLFLHSLLMGPVFVLVADLISRLIIQPMELPVGIILSAIGAPYLLYVLKRATKLRAL